MTRISIIDKLVGRYNNYIERLLITVLNSLLIFILLNKLGYNTYIDIIIPIVAIVSIVLPEIMAPIVTLLFAISELYTLYDGVTPLGILNGFIIILLALIIPIILEIKYQSLQAFISAESVLGIPLTSVLILSGISEKRSPLVNVLSALPIFYLLINFLKTNLVFSISEIEIIIISIAGILIGAYIFGINKIFSVLGVIPAILGFYIFYYDSFNFVFTRITMETMIISIAVAGSSILFYSIKESKAKHEKIQDQIDLIKKEIDETLLTLGRIKSYAELEEKFGSAITQDENTIIELGKQLDNCKNINCIQNIYPQFKEEKTEIENKINDLLFSLIIDYNNIVTELKKSGIKIEEMQIPKDKVKLNESYIDYIQKILLDINKNVNLALNNINTIIESIEKINGNKLNKYYITDYSVLPKAIDELQKNNVIISTSKLIEIEREIISNLNMKEFTKEKLEISRQINDLYSRQILISDIPQIEKISEKLVKLISSYITFCIDKLNSLSNISKIKSIENSLSNIRETKKILDDQSKPLYDKLSYVMSNIPSLVETEDIIENENSLIALFTILKDNEEIISNKMYEEGCIKVEDLGINSSLSKYVAEYFSSRNGIKTKIVKDEVCISK
ncbi:hypothetical protein [Acidianus manzaensis]|uniref:Uncharacterized protein n=1 Tax=Acidianus manzaensis TaxID=282676 RepID=A0A1W6K1A5_9CREN|nr:hypothetical protein [Acidianus manzaensis]ARM76341.1 hypothetical protein B6F84_10115 [Acidianus manzaensis]